GEPSPTRKCSRRFNRVRTATGSAMPLAIAAAWVSSTRRCGVISFSMLAEYSTITFGMAFSRDLSARFVFLMLTCQCLPSRRADHDPLVPAKAGTHSQAKVLDARFRGHERRVS